MTSTLRTIKEAFGQHPQPATRVVPAKSKPPAFSISKFRHDTGWNRPGAPPRPSVLTLTSSQAELRELFLRAIVR